MATTREQIRARITVEAVPAGKPRSWRQRCQDLEWAISQHRRDVQGPNPPVNFGDADERLYRRCAAVLGASQTLLDAPCEKDDE